MVSRRLGRTGLEPGPIGFGAFKIGRNEKTKYAAAYPLPSDEEAGRLLNDVLDMGIRWIDTAPAYGLSETRIGRHLSHRRSEFVLSTKVGEQFENGDSRYDFRREALQASIARSLRMLKTDAVDLLLLHVPGNDVEILTTSDAVPALLTAKQHGASRYIGLSAKTVEAARSAYDWADVLMVEYHLDDRSFDPVIVEAYERGIGIVIKKALASGRLPANEAIAFALNPFGVCSLTVGSLNREHLKSNLETGCRATMRD